MSALNIQTVTLEEAVSLIVNLPANRFILRGEPGIGKSSVMRSLAKELPDHHLCYLDMAAANPEDIGIPVPNHENRTLTFYSDSKLGLHLRKPVVIMYDEVTKGTRPVVNMVHPSLEDHNPRIAGAPLPDGSYVIMTGNLVTDGVGDILPAHTQGRVTELVISKPTADEWLNNYAVPAGIDPILCAFVSRTPHVLASYLDGDVDNPYIFQPGKTVGAYASPRSLSRCSSIIANRDKYSTNALRAALAGTVGAAAANDMMAFIAYQDQLPSWESIIADPMHAPVPVDPGAAMVLLFGSLERVCEKTFEPFAKYVERFEPEWQATFFIHMSKHPKKQAIGFKSKAFVEWIDKNQDLI